MQEVSSLYRDIYMSQNYYVETSLVVGEGGVLITEKAERILFGGTAILVSSSDADGGYGETMIISLKTTRRVFANNVPEVGCCPCGEIYVEMHMPKGNIERMAVLIPYVRLVSYEDGRCSEWIRKGVYYIDTRDNTHNDDDLDILTVHGYDAMMKAEVPYGSLYSELDFCLTDWTKSNGIYTNYFYDSSIVAEKEISVEYSDEDSIVIGQTITATQITGGVKFTTSTMPPSNTFGKVVLRDRNTLGFPASDIDVVRDIASKIGVSLDMRSDETHKSVPEYINKGYIVQYPTEYSMREVLGYIGAMYAGNWIINDSGELQFIALYDLPEETSILIDEIGYRLTFGTERTRILL